jgi:bifunctional non-homologous end joining protein LigD
MLATAWPERFNDDGWVFELKWDGVRCLLDTIEGRVRLTSRAGNDMTPRYPELGSLELESGMVLDGEIVAIGDNGKPSFELLQGRMNIVPPGASIVPVTYVVFDLLHDGSPLIQFPLEQRAVRLRERDLPAPIVKGDRFANESDSIWQFVVDNELEGIVAKRRDSKYRPGVRSPDWRKIGNFRQLRAVVGGFTPGTGGRADTFGSVLVGLVHGERLRWIGAVGSGFDQKSLTLIRDALGEMTTAECPFHPDPELPAGSVWVEPRLVAMVRFKQWTRTGRLRAPSFKGFTDDPVDVVTWLSEGPVAGN